jgi:PAS domain S-box-containing protein
MRDLNSWYWVWNLENQEITCSSRLLERIGVNPSRELSPHAFWEFLIDPDDQPSFFSKIEELLENPDCTSFLQYCALKNGESAFHSIKISGELLSDQIISGQIEFISDDLSESDRYLLKLLMDHLPHSIFFKDRESRFIRINQTCAEKFGLERPGEAVGKTDFDFFEDEHAQQALEDEKYVLRSGKPIIDKSEREVFSNDQQSVKWASTSKIPMYGINGEIIGTFGITKDITKSKQQQDELNETIAIISDQNNRFQNFAHMVSHNLRNHAGNITMILSLVEVAESDRELDELLAHLTTASDRLNDTIEDLNEIVDSQSKSDYDLKPVNLFTVYQKVKDILSTEIMIHNVDFEELIPEDFEIHYNQAYMESILLNLMSNAIKYRHPKRNPVIGVKVYQSESGPVLKVTDNGVGIDLDKYGKKLFGMYNTFHSNKNSKGIGLYITKNQVESLGGCIEVDSKPNRGTTFTVYFGS